MASTDELLKSHWWRSTTVKIYSSHVLSSWGDRMWSFALGIYLYYLNPNSLQLTGIYGFASCISIIIFGAVIGKWIDKTERLRVAKVALFVQNFSVSCCAAIVVVRIAFDDDIQKIWNGALDVILIAVIIFIGVLADVGTVAMKIALEKDWIVVLAAGDEYKLAQMNSVMRTIDLTTSILSPIIVGQMMSYGGTVWSAVFIVGWNILSVTIEYYLLSSIYKQMPSLEKKNGLAGIMDNESSNIPNGVHGHAEKNQNCSKVTGRLTELRNSWRDYFNHYIRNAGLALALLYMTVLGFDNITRGYAMSQGVSESLLGIYTAIGAIFGILGSLLFPWLRKTFGKFVTGNIGFGSETITLLACIASIFTYGSPVYDKIYGTDVMSNDSSVVTYSYAELWNRNLSVNLLLIGIVLARFGLWVADINVSQIFQENIAESQRGSINGVQNSLNQGMNLIKFILVIILPNTATFPYLIAVSWLAVFLGWILFMIFCCQKEPHGQLNQ